MTWNPVTGCYHGCPYCYARKIAVRFGKLDETGRKTLEKMKPVLCLEKEIGNPYPYNFYPTYHRYRLNEPSKKREPQNIFVCSMADLFGDWMPAEYITEIMQACKDAPQHRYMFLSKNPKRYREFESEYTDNMWLGTTITNNDTVLNAELLPENAHNFLSIEPLKESLKRGFNLLTAINNVEWVIIGAEIGTAKGKVIPQKEWIDDIVDICDICHVPVFMKESVKPIIGEENMRRKFPWKRTEV